ncbi:virulence factor [Chroococcidiopsis sp. TS-821]|uniref:virulence factor n=1 Tax=Chroococcidiopsis sp. TS-821 TaxID=1378066 RepID=UPI000CEE90A7|nr:virulence factor [Chroococcidiopsis sp. TS-821]PPS44740.1 PBS lyase [Chroococcidiopsis sp. TS-821]
MQLLSIETTPSPSCIKLNLNESISTKALTLQQGVEQKDTPALAQQLLAIENIQSVFLFKDFITLTRKGNADWQPILNQAVRIIGVAKDADANKLLANVEQPQEIAASHSTNLQQTSLGHVEVAVQMFRGIPVQVRAIASDGQQARVALPERFNEALQRVISATKANYIAERRWEPYQSPAGALNEVAQLVADEIASLIDEDELARIAAAAIANDRQPGLTNQTSQQELLADLQHPNWKQRLKALQQIEVTPETFSQVVALLDDEQSTIRRWAAALLGTSSVAIAVEPLCRVILTDPSAIVRRTAGDALNDLGEKSAIATMCQALADPSKLVRWRAARFLNEMGDQSAIAALRRAVEREAEFDVRIEMLAALERIEGGGETQLPMWQRITQGELTE